MTAQAVDRRRGFTLIEVVVSLLVLEVAVVGVVGALVLASSTMTRAEVIERAIATADGVVDSLAQVEGLVSGSVAHEAGTVTWVVADSGRLTLHATGPAGDSILELRASVARLP